MTAGLAVTIGDLADFLARLLQERRREVSDERGK